MRFSIILNKQILSDLPPNVLAKLLIASSVHYFLLDFTRFLPIGWMEFHFFIYFLDNNQRRYLLLQIFAFVNPISTMWLKDTLYTCDGLSAIWYFPLLLTIGNGHVTMQSFIKQYFPVLFKTDDDIKTIQGFSFTWVLVTLPYITSYLHTLVLNI